jgi:hypothetical protein
MFRWRHLSWPCQGRRPVHPRKTTMHWPIYRFHYSPLVPKVRGDPHELACPEMAVADAHFEKIHQRGTRSRHSVQNREICSVAVLSRSLLSHSGRVIARRCLSGKAAFGGCNHGCHCWPRDTHHSVTLSRSAFNHSRESLRQI